MSSTLPLLLSLADELESLTTQTYPDDFGLGFYPHRHYHRNASTPSIQLSLPAHNFLERPARTRRKSYDLKSNSIIGNNTNNYNRDGRYHRNGYHQVCMNVQDFKPNDLLVKITEDTIIVEGKHDEREDEHGLISRQFIRKYPLPDGYDTNEAISTLSIDGILTIKIPANDNKYLERNTRILDIQQTGKKHPKDDENNDNDDDDDNDTSNNYKDNKIKNGKHYVQNNDNDDDSSDNDDDQDKIRRCKD